MRPCGTNILINMQLCPQVSDVVGTMMLTHQLAITVGMHGQSQSGTYQIN